MSTTFIRLWGGRLAAQEQTVQHHAGQHVEDEVEVDVVADLAARQGAVEQQAVHRDARRHERALEGGGQVGVEVHGGDEAGQQVDGHLVAEPALVARHGEQVTAQGAGVGHGERGAVVGPHHDVDHQVALVGPPPVQRGLADVRRRGEGVHRQPVVPHLAQQQQRGVEDLGLALTRDAGAGRRLPARPGGVALGDGGHLSDPLGTPG
ncbi:hypothetical protein GCM10025868_00120 [Angustibacter aerolatus]|uniref:Uncharacterized protein n=1 Tax=Angustibacter aerolatus TaxID=1162965 RepID=A0ABQ6J9C7_9ACTN|nr:hypothetical protein GCM10025868_00120 [Angustibacter aerolatus]